MAGPADDAWHAEAAFHDRSFRLRERRGAAIRPGERFGAVVGGENDNGVIVQPRILEMLHHQADVVVELRHAGFFDGPTILRVHHCRVFGREVGDHVHARRVHPDKEWLAIGKPFFVWMNPTRMHVVTHLSPKYAAMMNSENGWSIEEAGMAQLDDDVGLVMQHLKDAGLDDNTIVVFTTDNGTETFTWPDGGTTPFAQAKGTIMEGGFRVPCIVRWPGHVAPDSVQNGIMSGLDWLPTFVSLAGNPNITQQLLKGVKIGDRTYKNHLDGYDQTAMLTGKGPSNRHEIFYLGESTIGAVRIDDYKYRFIDQPQGWLGVKNHPDVPVIVNLRLDPFEKMAFPEDMTRNGSLMFFGDWYMYQFWRFVFVQQVMGKEIQTFLEFPPMQRGASFNLDALKAEMGKRMAEAEAAAKGPSN